ncbi:hypothetical protein XA26_58570 [Mycolicibacterium fortuitum]|uniref:Uncharacterized protein n=1 Tax=Mycolicibacterium fortuitum TaxID=1766 RepID=A0A0N9YE11_MYCFO|nr:hypothetical protein XA26_58570 [Mycolicibacterium fortuitum]
MRQIAPSGVTRLAGSYPPRRQGASVNPGLAGPSNVTLIEGTGPD